MELNNQKGPVSPMEVFHKEAPEVAGAFNNLIKELSSTRGLDSKTRQLIYISMKAMQGDTAAVVAHTPMAKQAGASREELKDAVLLTLTVSGIKGVVSCLPAALSAYDNC
ncbi:MAG: Carboxymuconolactone decarboxylase [Eubacterium sp.]|jgi:AhpD family alkylhydroperoxidase|nr:Carboxymuconolactone decarboxylase [Eubacterium sp.]